MAALFLTGLGGHTRLNATKHVREAMKVFDSAATASDAYRVTSVVHREGFALLGETDDPDRMIAAAAVLEHNSLPYAMFSTVERGTLRLSSQQMTANGATPEEVFATTAADAPGDPDEDEGAPVRELTPEVRRVALAIVAMADGNPLTAGGYIINLARASGQERYWLDVLLALGEVFPWVVAIIQERGDVE